LQDVKNSVFLVTEGQVTEGQFRFFIFLQKNSFSHNFQNFHLKHW